MIKHIIWDLDGTLINSEPEVLEHINKAVTISGVDSRYKISEFRIGPTIKTVLKNAYSQITDEQIEKVINEFRSSYDNSLFETTLPFDGIEDILSSTSKYITHHIVTNKPQYPTIRIIEKLKWNGIFATISSPQRDNGITVSKAILMNEIITKFGIKRDEVISIGDMDTDAIAARENGIYSVGVTWGTGIKRELDVVCNIVIDSVSQLKSTINLL